MNDAKRHLLERLPGSFGLRNGHGFAFGEHPSIATLPLCEPARAGEKRRIPGGTGVADTEVTCQKGADDTWEWVEASDLNPVSLTAAWVMLSKTDFSAASSVSLPANTFTSTYRQYAILAFYSISANANMVLRMRAAGSDDSANAYYVTAGLSTSVLSLHNAGNASATSGLLHGAPGTTLTQGLLTIIMDAPQVAAVTTWQSDASMRFTTPAMGRYFASGMLNNNTVYDSLTLFPASGTITGAVRVYGIQSTIGDGFTGYTDEAARDAIGSALVAGANTTITVDDSLNTITIASTGGGGSSSIADILMLGGM
jgi:hypothetical protein